MCELVVVFADKIEALSWVSIEEAVGICETLFGSSVDLMC